MQNSSTESIVKSLQYDKDELLKMVNALRDALEKERNSSEERVQKALAKSHSELVHLKETITALRDELEKQKVMYEEKLMKATKREHDEKEQLRRTIFMLRECLEKNNAQ